MFVEPSTSTLVGCGRISARSCRRLCARCVHEQGVGVIHSGTPREHKRGDETETQNYWKERVKQEYAVRDVLFVVCV